MRLFINVFWNVSSTLGWLNTIIRFVITNGMSIPLTFFERSESENIQAFLVESSPKEFIMVAGVYFTLP